MVVMWYAQSGADPGFPVAEGANPPGGAPTYSFAKLCEKLHEIEKILGHRGGARRGRLPPKFATDNGTLGSKTLFQHV